MLASGVDWTYIIVALIAGLPAIISAIYAGSVHRQIKTPSGMTIGRQVEGVHHVAIANNQRLVSVNDKLDAQPSALAGEEEEQVPKLNGERELGKGGA